jgi:hypothetical protein
MMQTNTRGSVYTECNLRKKYFSLLKLPGVSERMWSVNLDASISGEYYTLEGESGRPSEQVGSPMIGYRVH